MDVFEAIKKRRSIRKFKNIDVEDEKILKILDAGRYAPSGLNNQPWRFHISKGEEKDEISKFTKYGKIIKNSNLCISVFIDTEDIYNRERDLMAVGACIENMLLEVENLDLGACWIGEILNNKEKVREFLKLDKRYELMAVIAIGYKDETPHSERKSLNELMI